MTLRLFATAPRGAEDLLAGELRAMGVDKPRARHGGVAFAATLDQALRACLWSRVASRILCEIGELDATDADALYRSARALRWAEHLAPGRSFAISASGRAGEHSGIDNSHFAALRVKDAIVDQLREQRGQRPDVEIERPDLRLHLHLRGDRALVSVDLSGEGLHRRGYRVARGVAPLRENLAAAVLLRAGWQEAGELVCLDPMCGSGTLLIEAAWIATDTAPGLLRERWGFAGWAGHDPGAWAALVDEARGRARAGRARATPRLLGFDQDPAAVESARACIAAAGLEGGIPVEVRAIDELAPPEGSGELGGFVVSNPPWGERMSPGARRELESLYAGLGRRLREGFGGWEVALLVGDPSLGRALGLRAHHRNSLHDGPIACQILRLHVPEEAAEAETTQRRHHAPRERSEGARAFANRLAKNERKLRSWRRREEITCYRLYDADIPETNFAVDIYEDADSGLRHAHVQEYAPPRTVKEADARRRRGEALAVIREDLELPRERVHLKRRERQRGRAQYRKLEDRREEFVVREGPARVWVNLDDYLDTGLFLDHRPTRARLAERAADRRVLNLFCYTGVATVRMALAGARSTTSVDLSRTYLEWAARNMALNQLSCVGPDVEPRRRGRSGPRHQLVRADVLEWLRQQGSRRWDLIFCDPPSFSNSKQMDTSFDVQRDHVTLIRRCVDLLAPAGELVFSTNLRRFSLDEAALDRLVIEPARDSVPPDFARRQAIHHVFWIHRC